MAFLHKRLDHRNHFVAHLPELSLWGQCVVHGNHALPGVIGEDRGSAERGFRAVKRVSAAVHIDNNLWAFHPTFGTDLHDRDAAKIAFSQGWA